MESGIRVGHEESGKTVRDIAESITAILSAGFEARAESKVMVAALAAFREATSISGIAIHGASVAGDTHNHYALELEPDDDDEDE